MFNVVVPESNPLSQYEKLTFKDLKDQRFSSLSDNFMIGRLLLDRTGASVMSRISFCITMIYKYFFIVYKKIIRFVCCRLNIMKWEKVRD